MGPKNILILCNDKKNSVCDMAGEPHDTHVLWDASKQDDYAAVVRAPCFTRDEVRCIVDSALADVNAENRALRARIHSLVSSATAESGYYAGVDYTVTSVWQDEVDSVDVSFKSMYGRPVYRVFYFFCLIEPGLARISDDDSPERQYPQIADPGVFHRDIRHPTTGFSDPPMHDGITRLRWYAVFEASNFDVVISYIARQEYVYPRSTLFRPTGGYIWLAQNKDGAPLPIGGVADGYDVGSERDKKQITIMYMESHGGIRSSGAHAGVAVDMQNIRLFILDVNTIVAVKTPETVPLVSTGIVTITYKKGLPVGTFKLRKAYEMARAEIITRNADTILHGEHSYDMATIHTDERGNTSVYLFYSCRLSYASFQLFQFDWGGHTVNLKADEALVRIRGLPDMALLALTKKDTESDGLDEPTVYSQDYLQALTRVFPVKVDPAP
jgi:hypothetical protein